MLKAMDPISGIGSGQSAQAAGDTASSEDLALLKKSQDLAKSNAAQLLATLPPPRSPSPPGVGGKIDISA